MTAIAAGSWVDGKLEAHTVKTEHMPVVLKDLLDAGYAVSEEDITNAEFKHGCPHCKRTFSTNHGLYVHIGRWCGEAEREEFA